MSFCSCWWVCVKTIARLSQTLAGRAGTIRFIDGVGEMSRVKGSPKTGGRVAGTPNKVTTTLREAILGAFEDAGGRKWLAGLATSHPQVLATLVGKLLPQSLANDPENPVTAPPSGEA